MIIAPFYLFLDFDGVLHAEESGMVDPFVLADRLGAALTRFPEVRVVVSSSWREVHCLDEMRDFCGTSLGPRLVDVTPVLAPAEPSARDMPHVRFAEIAMWLAAARNAHSLSMTIGVAALARHDWAALDDSDFWFPPGCEQLIHVENDAGLNESHLQRLDERLHAHRRWCRDGALDS